MIAKSTRQILGSFVVVTAGALALLAAGAGVGILLVLTTS
jgi:hypothetical protein